MQGSGLVVLLGLAAAISWGILDYAAARSAKIAGPLRASYLAYVIGSLLYVIFYFVFLQAEAQFDPSVLWYAVGAAAINVCGLAALYRGLAIGPVSIVSPVSSFFPLITTLVLVLVFGNTLSPIQIVGIVFVVVGGVVAAGLFNTTSRSKLGKGPLFGLAAAGFWGIGFALLSQSIAALGWQLATLLQVSIGAVAYTAMLPLLKGKEKIFVRSSLKLLKNKFIIGAAVFSTGGLLLLNFAVGQSQNLAPVAIAISGCYPIIAVVLALFKLKEKLRPVPLIGAAVGIAGVVILTVG